MTESSVEPAMLVALTSGLSHFADPLECEDMRGPRSLFGEGARMPKPLRSEFGLTRRDILWEGAVAGSGRAAAAIAAAGHASLHRVTHERLAVPATTYISGTCTSTFTVAWRLAEAGLLPEWGAVLCSRQTEGRGQMRRAWHSPRGNLYVTFRLPAAPNLQGDAAALIIGYLLTKAFAALRQPLLLKWPNDLLLENGCKVGGILLEERNNILLAGVGVNLAEAPLPALLREGAAGRAAVLLPSGEAIAANQALSGGSPEQEADSGADEPFAPFALWRSLVSETILEYGRSVAGRPLAEVLLSIDAMLAWKGRAVTLADDNGTSLSGRHMGIGAQGGLILRFSDGQCREVFSGSLSLAASSRVRKEPAICV